MIKIIEKREKEKNYSSSYYVTDPVTGERVLVEEMYRRIKERENEVNEGTSQLVTDKQLIEFGFYLYPKIPRSQLTDEQINARVDEINNMLHEYGITSSESIAIFMGNVAQETGKGWFLLEYGDVEYDETDLYNGAGYIQLTRKTNYESFAKYLYNKEDVSDTPIMKKGKYEVSQNYEWDASGWFWRYGEQNITI